MRLGTRGFWAWRVLGTLCRYELIKQLATELGIELTLDDLYADARPLQLAERWLGQAGASAPPMTPGDTGAELRDKSDAEHLQAVTRDLALADAFPWVGSAADTVPRRILLTGATGFLGGHTLFDLLRHSDAHIVCIVRADDDERGKRRLAAALSSFELPWSTELQRRITVVAGDLGQDHLGWSDERWQHFADEIDSVVNIAAEVDFLRSYESLRATNVLGPLTLATFAATGRIKPLHHISSVAVFNQVGMREIDEDSPVARLDHLHAGYDQSKWAAEALLRRVREHGLSVTFHRSGGILGHSRTGVYNAKDLGNAFIAIMLAT